MKRVQARLVLIPDTPAVLRFRDLGAPFAVRVVRGGWDGLGAALRDAHPSTVALVDPYAGRADGTLAPELRELMRRHPATPWVTALPFRPDERTADARTLLAWGASELVDLELETTSRAAAPRLHAAHARTLKRRVEPTLARAVSQRAVILLRAAAEVVADGGAAPDLALRFGVGERTVTAWCAREALPPPRRLLSWMRVLLAATLAEEPGRTMAAAARACGYATDRSLRRATASLVGEGDARAGSPGSFGAAAAAFRAELRDLREAVREKSRARRIARERRDALPPPA